MEHSSCRSEQWRLVIYFFLAGLFVFAALMRFFLLVFLNFVEPPFMGPLLQGTAFIFVILGCQLAMQRGSCTSWYAAIGCVLVSLALLVAAKWLKISLVGLRTYGAMWLVSVAAVAGGSWVVSSIANRIPPAWRVAAGTGLIMAGVLLPALIAGMLAVDRL